MQGLLLDLVVGIVVAGVVLAVRYFGPKAGRSYGRLIETALAATAGLVAGLVVIVYNTDLVPDWLEPSLIVVLVSAITVVLIAGTGYRLTRRGRLR